MSTTTQTPPGSAADSAKGNKQLSLDELYLEAGHHQVNLGAKKIHAKRIPGKFRNLKWFAASLYILFFIGPYFRWEGRQAVLFNVPERQYHLFELTLWPQDVWILSLALLTFFLALYAATAMAGRVFCGTFCWMTVWTDVYTWIEEKMEGSPPQRRALDSAPWGARKLAIKTGKTLVFLLLGVATGVTFTSYFIDAGDLWRRYLSLRGPVEIWVTPLPFVIGTYLGVGIMREQFCFWLCPYARIQSAMQDSETIIPTYDVRRGEPRGRHKDGDCIDCHLCVGVCPTGVDIRDGMQEGCIMCALCIDACNSVMRKVDKPEGLIRYGSLDEFLGLPVVPLYKRPRIIMYAILLASTLSGIVWGLTHLGAVQLNVIHERQPLYVMLSDGGVQNKYTLRIVNKSDTTLNLRFAVSDLPGAVLVSPDAAVRVAPGRVLPLNATVRMPRSRAGKGSVKVEFHVLDSATGAFITETESRFIGPG
ncbi:MAG: cytochrome c oxidase accessory protein CcoG [Nitrospinae bacterium]|nr:cytochrome c oxidase accessory protein CcoG [Nitrospinota bacterium]